jgi:hypothetical protein
LRHILSRIDMSNWQRWKENLGDLVEFAQELGVPRDRVQQLAVNFGDYLAEHVDPSTPQYEVLKELWQAGSPDERNTLAALMMKVVERRN